jgi:nicotinate-nucleotide adenylyltransferase
MGVPTLGARVIAEDLRPQPASVGILGGTFDPIHIGHLAVAEEVREALGLERILFVPAAVPPHKPGQPIGPAEDRAAMVALAIRGNPAFELSRIELDRPGPSYAVDTLELLSGGTVRDDDLPGPAEPSESGDRPGSRRQPPAPESGPELTAGAPWPLTFILSMEALLGLPAWREPWRVIDLARMAVVPRSGLARPDDDWFERAFPGRLDRFTFLDGPQLDISATAIRTRVEAGRSIRYLVPEDVRSYIGDHGLYRHHS